VNRFEQATVTDLVSELPWGTHACHFYQTQSDVLDIFAPYFKAGLSKNHYCIWIEAPRCPLGDIAHETGSVDGKLNIQSAPGRGTEVMIEIPKDPVTTLPERPATGRKRWTFHKWTVAPSGAGSRVQV
jgi:hypothetical protein